MRAQSVCGRAFSPNVVGVPGAARCCARHAAPSNSQRSCTSSVNTSGMQKRGGFTWRAGIAESRQYARTCCARRAGAAPATLHGSDAQASCAARACTRTIFQQRRHAFAHSRCFEGGSALPAQKYIGMTFVVEQLDDGALVHRPVPVRGVQPRAQRLRPGVLRVHRQELGVVRDAPRERRDVRGWRAALGGARGVQSTSIEWCATAVAHHAHAHARVPPHRDALGGPEDRARRVRRGARPVLRKQHVRAVRARARRLQAQRGRYPPRRVQLAREQAVVQRCSTTL
jgi:hypothetical protein